MKRFGTDAAVVQAALRADELFEGGEEQVTGTWRHPVGDTISGRNSPQLGADHRNEPSTTGLLQRWQPLQGRCASPVADFGKAGIVPPE